MITQIIPNKKMPRNIKYFDYLIPEKLEAKMKIGQIVKIPFRNQKLNGIVFTIKERGEIKKLKPILELTEHSLPSFQIKLLEWMNKNYFSCFPSLLKLMIPEIPQRKFQVNPIEILDKKALNIKKEDLPKIKKISENILNSNRPSLLHFDNESNKNLCLVKIISEQLKKEKQNLIILPQITDIATFVKFLNQYFKEEIAFIHSGLSKTLNWNYWQKINSGQIKIIIGTKSAIFAPLKNLGVIIIENEHSLDHKQYEQNPRYDTRDIALEISKNTKCKLIYTSHTPQIETYFKTQNNEYLLARLLSNKKHIYQTINLKSTFKNETSWIFSQRIIEKIKQNIQTNKKTVLFINRKGLNTSLICQDCGFSLKCPSCDLPFDSFEDKEGAKLRCLHCNITKENVANCPKCKSHNIKNFGIGSQKIEKEIKKIIPQASLIRIDKDEEKKLTNINLSPYQIIIGTPFLLKNYWDKIKNLGTFVVVSFDGLLNITEYTANEKAYQLIKEIQIKTLAQNADLVIQTFNPDNKVLNTINDYDNFYADEIKERKIFNYPPFKKLIKLTFQHKDKKQCEMETWRVYNLIKKRRFASLELTEPIACSRSKLRNNYKYDILMKIDKKDFEKLDFSNLPSEWIID